MRYKSKRSRACDISQEVKDRVWHRDHGRCVICGHVGFPNAHYINRSHGGLGIEQNIVTLCPVCHEAYDNGNRKEEIKAKLQEYLCKQYECWDESKLVYNKWGFLRFKN